MSYSLIANASAAGTPAGATTPGVNTTGANLIVVFVASFSAQPFGRLVVSDSKGNNWTAVTHQASAFSASGTIFYCLNPKVGSVHTFSASDTLGQDFYPSLFVQAWSGAAAPGAFDAENGATSTGTTSLSPGSVTPAAGNELIVTGICVSAIETLSINGGFTISDTQTFSGGIHFGGGMAYLVEGVAASANPAWSFASPTDCAACIACFKSGRGGSIFGRSIAQLKARRQKREEEEEARKLIAAGVFD